MHNSPLEKPGNEVLEFYLYYLPPNSLIELEYLLSFKTFYFKCYTLFSYPFTFLLFSKPMFLFFYRKTGLILASITLLKQAENGLC